MRIHPPHFRLLLGLAFAVFAALCSTSTAAAEDFKSQVYEREYRLRELSQHDAEVLIWEQCPKSTETLCRVRGSGVRDGAIVVVVFADDATHQKIAQALAEKDGIPPTRAFQVVLLVAERKGAGGIPADLPANCKKALQDVAGFLPFGSYRLLDVGWIRTTEAGNAQLAGLGTQPFYAQLHVRNRLGDQLFVDQFSIKDRATVLLSTSFSLKKGETIVVGTSKLDGDDSALVTLVSALE